MRRPLGHGRLRVPPTVAPSAGTPRPSTRRSPRTGVVRPRAFPALHRRQGRAHSPRRPGSDADPHRQNDRSGVPEVSMVTAGRAQRRMRMRSWSRVRRAPEQDAWTIVLVVAFAIVGVFALVVGLLYVAVTFTAGGQP